jgi:small subunit ribosomal protein S3
LGQKTHPIGLRLGIIRNWDANWYDEKNFAQKLGEDLMIRNYIKNRFKKAGITKVIIERTPKSIVLTLYTSRPGIVIGKSGKEISQVEEELKKITMKSNVLSWMLIWLQIILHNNWLVEYHLEEL